MMNRRYVPDSENKLVILYALNRLGPVTGMQLLQFLVEADLMNYFAMQLNLSELQEQGQVAERSHPLGPLLALTDTGAYTLGAFDHRIPASRRSLIDQAAPAWHERFRTEQQTLAESFPLSDGRLCIRLRLLEADTALLDLLLTLGEASMTCLQRRWRSAAQQVYDTLTAALGADFDAAAPLPPLPSSATLQQVAQAEWLLSLSDPADRPTMTLMLPLPEENLAHHYASRWPAQSASLRSRIMALLEAE